MAVRLPALLLALAAAAASDAPSTRGRLPELERVAEDLGASSRVVRDAAEVAARARARLDPSAVEALWESLDARGRCGLVRALGGAGTAHAAELAFRHAGDPDPELFASLLAGLADGGEKSLFAPSPESLSGTRAEALESVRTRWRVEAEIARLKHPTGPTGHYVGQFERVKAVGAAAMPTLFAIVTDQELPLPGEAATGPYQAIHPDMVRYERRELRQMVANGLGAALDPSDGDWRDRLRALWHRYWYEFEDDASRRYEHEDLAPQLAFSLSDLGEGRPVDTYLASLRSRMNFRGGDPSPARWQLAYALVRIGRQDEGEAEYEELLLDETSDRRDLTAYNLACALSMRSLQEPQRRNLYRRKALDYLERAETLGYTEWPWMEQDRDLDAIRDDDRYKGVRDRLKARYPGRKASKPK